MAKSRVETNENLTRLSSDVYICAYTIYNIVLISKSCDLMTTYAKLLRSSFRTATPSVHPTVYVGSLLHDLVSTRQQCLNLGNISGFRQQDDKREVGTVQCSDFDTTFVSFKNIVCLIFPERAAEQVASRVWSLFCLFLLQLSKPRDDFVVACVKVRNTTVGIFRTTSLWHHLDNILMPRVIFAAYYYPPATGTSIRFYLDVVYYTPVERIADNRQRDCCLTKTSGFVLCHAPTHYASRS